MLNKKIITNNLIDKLRSYSGLGDIKKFSVNRLYDFADTDLPAISIKYENEDVEIYSQSPKQSIRTLELKIEILCKGTVSYIDEFLDDTAWEVENIMNFDNFLTIEGEKILNRPAQIINISKMISSQGTPIGSIEMTYELEYITTDISTLNTISDLKEIRGVISQKENNQLEMIAKFD